MHEFEFIPQYKGKDLKKVARGNLKDNYFVGTKYDGHYVQIHKFGNEVMFFTSGGKPFKLDDVEEYIVENNKGLNFILETEHIGLTDGKLGSRGKCTTTTWFTNFTKGIKCNAGKKHFKAFDLLYFRTNKGLYGLENGNYYYNFRKSLMPLIELGLNISAVKFEEMSLIDITIKADLVCADGWEGLFGFHENHLYEKTNTSRSNLAIKFKAAPTADLLCVDVKYSDINPQDIASLICKNKKGQVVAAGHLIHELKRKDPSFFIGRIIEVKYESMGVNTYQQPRFKSFRNDKTKEDID